MYITVFTIRSPKKLLLTSALSIQNLLSKTRAYTVIDSHDHDGSPRNSALVKLFPIAGLTGMRTFLP